MRAGEMRGQTGRFPSSSAAASRPNPTIHPNNSAVEFTTRPLKPKPLHDPEPSVSLFIVILSKRFCAAKDLGEPREAPRLLRRSNRAFGSHPNRERPRADSAHLATPEVQSSF
jgi:hypothetical protein